MKQPLPERVLPRMLALLAAALLLLTTVGIAACGDEGGGQDVNTVLDETFGGKSKIDSGQIEIDMRADLEGAAQLTAPVSVQIKGPFESRGDKQVPKLQLEMTAGSGVQKVSAGITSTGTKGFIKFQDAYYAIPANLFRQFQRELRRQDSANGAVPDLTTLGVDPREWLVDPKDEGTEDIGGVETIHITSDVNVDKMIDDLDELLGKTNQLGLSREQRRQLPREIPAETKKQITDSVKTATIDVYTGKEDKVLRKLAVELEFDVPEDLRSQTAGVSAGKVDFTVEVTELNESQEIETPRRARPLSELQEQLGALRGLSGSLGGTTGGSGAGGSGSGSGSSSGAGAPQVDSAKTRRYTRCVEKAKGVDDITACGDLLR